MDTSISDEPTEDPRGTLSKEELRESVAALEQSREDVAAGRTRDFREALQDIAGSFCLPVTLTTGKKS